MKIYEQRRELTRALHADLGSGYVIAPNPDHPLLLEGPDALVGGDGGMLAIFMLKAKERARPRCLEARFILSRFALPSYVRHVLVVDETPHNDTIEKLGINFAAVLEWRNRRDITKIARDKEFIGGQQELPQKITAFVRRRFADALQTTRVIQRIDQPHRSKRTPEPQDRLRATRAPFSYVGPDALFAGFGRGTPDSAAIRSLIDKTTLDGFGLDQSVPYPTRKDDYGVALIDRFPEYRGDPYKLTRAAAFAGWTLIPETQQHLINTVAERLHKHRSVEIFG